MVLVGPPLSPSDPSSRFAPTVRLLPLLPERVNPVVLPTALKFTLTVAVLWMSGPLVLVLPDTTELATVTVPVAVFSTAIPPPPDPDIVPAAVFPVIVLLVTTIDPDPLVSAIAPPPRPVVVVPPFAAFPVRVLFWTSRVPVKLRRTMPPPAAAVVLLLIALLRTSAVPAVNPAGGAVLTVPKK